MANNATGPQYPSTTSDGGSGSGAAWSNTSNIRIPNGVYATGDISGGGYISSQLKSNSYGFTIPSTALITGIYVEVLRDGTAAVDHAVQIIKGGSLAGTAKSPGTSVPSFFTYQGFGGDGDLWGAAWTPADINASNFGVMYQARNTTGGGTIQVDAVRITVYWRTAPADVPKRYDYKVYRNGLFLGNLPTPKNDFSLSQEINTGGSQITIEVPVSADTSMLPSSGAILDETGANILDELGDPILSEGAASLVGLGTGTTLIKNGNRVVVWEYSYYWPNGHVAFSGEMERWEATFGGDAQDNSISILCYSDGSDLDNYLLLGSPFTYTVDQSQATQNARASIHLDSSGAYSYFAQGFTTGASITNLGGIYIMLDGIANVTVNVYQDSSMTTVLASTTVNVNVVGPTEVLFGFANHIFVTSSTSYFFTVTVASGQSIWIHYNNANPYSGGTMYSASYAGGSGGGAYAANSTQDLYFKTASSSGQTTATFSGQDPSTGMLVGFMQDYRSRGGNIVTTSDSIQATALNLNYQFNTNTIYEGIQAALAVSPSGFYYYVDLPTNTLYFKKANTAADILLTKGVHINKLSVIATIENIYNVVYFSGGTVSGSNIYKAYQDAPSIALYGQKLQRISANRVTDSSTADAIGTSARDSNKNEQFQTTVTVLDKQMDISSLRVGMVVGFRAFGSFVDNMLTQIVRIDYTPEAATLTLGVLPVRLNTELEQITRGLIAQETIANPATPS